ncbi:MAG: indolepyruvate oxidoreductase subunit beta [Planctomycetes bacterium]|nr:indolepyruvate oxidoreductase subunit beta [Planctomycetota bacterium]
MNVLLVGVGGQGTLTASAIIADAALRAGYDVKQSEVHGMAQRGGSVSSHVRFGPEVHSPIIPAGEADLLVAFEELEGRRWRHALRPGGTLLRNLERIPPASVALGSRPYPAWDPRVEEGIAVVSLDARAIARSVGEPRALSVVIVGAASASLDFPPGVWEESLAAVLPAKILEVNRKAFAAGRGAVIDAPDGCGGSGRSA